MKNIQVIDGAINCSYDIFAVGVWKKRQNKKTITGIHGTLFYDLIEEKKKFYPTNRENEMIANPD